MIHGLLMGVPFHSSPQVELPPMPVDEAATPAKPDPQTDQDQAQALDTLFAQTQPDQDQSAMACLMGLWTSGMLLTEITRDHFNRETKEEPHLPNRESDADDELA